jgi:hypothetical protein
MLSDSTRAGSAGGVQADGCERGDSDEDLLPSAARPERYNLTDSPFNNVMILLYPTSRRST